MANDAKGDLKINGSGSAAGGSYDKIEINGAGKINGDVICRTFRINGSGSVAGNLETEDGKINGSGEVDGHTKAQQFSISGSGQVKGGMRGDSLTISGSASIGESVDVQNVKIEGSAKIGGDCNAEHFQVTGSFEINGLLNADEIDIRLGLTRSRVKEIGGRKIQVSVGPLAGLNMLRSILSLGAHNPVLETETIEGDEITLENTVAKFVRGGNITIGRGCDIGLVEYKGVLNKSSDAKVNEEKKV
jgi:cytoskeletal protein CcmA (bactofilin family)